MAFSSMERERRKRTLQRIMETADLRALILLGDTNVGNNLYGDFRYYVDNRIIFCFPAVLLGTWVDIPHLMRGGNDGNAFECVIPAQAGIRNS